MMYIEASAKTGENVDNVSFNYLDFLLNSRKNCQRN